MHPFSYVELLNSSYIKLADYETLIIANEMRILSFWKIMKLQF